MPKKRDHNLAPDGVEDDGDRRRPAASKFEVMHSVSGGVTRFPITKGDRGQLLGGQLLGSQHDGVSQTHTRPMKFRPSTGKRRIIGRKSHQLVPDEVQEMPKSLPTTGVTRPNNVGRTFTLRRKLDTLGHGLASWATSVAQQPKPAKTGHHRKDLAERRHSATKSLWERQRGAAVVRQRPTEAQCGQSITAPRRSFPRATSSSHGSPTMKVFKSFFLHVQSSQESQGQISFLVSLPEIRFQEKGDCYVRVIDPVTLSSSNS